MTPPLPQPLAQAIKQMGHRIVRDPVHALSLVSRWTCTSCGKALMKTGPNYSGSALDEPCLSLAPRSVP